MDPALKTGQTSRMPSSHVSIFVHIVFSTKERRSLIQPEWESRLHSYLGGMIKGMDAIPVSIGGMPDHTHILTGLRSKHRLDYFTRDIKGDSSEWIHKEITPMFEWQKGYGAFSVSPTALEAVSSYITNQKVHHSRVSFPEEYVDLLQKSGTAYDEKFLW
jgi:putative transposase